MKLIKTRFFVSIAYISIILGFLFPSVGAADTCEKWLAKVVSVKGTVEARRAGEVSWVSVKQNDTFRSEVMIRAEERSRASLYLCDGSTETLDQKTAITLSLDVEETLLTRVINGAVHFFSRFPRRLKLRTRFLDGDIEGTEFFVRVEQDHTFISIFEGRVRTENETGSLVLASGQSAIAKEGQAPELQIVARPRDAVKWALYYPPILDYRAADFPDGVDTDWQGMVRKSIEFYWQGELVKAFSSIERVHDDIRDPRFFTYRAGLLLTVGRVDEAGADIKRALDLDPSNSHAFAFQSIIAVVQNEKDRALELASKAVEVGPGSSAVRVALSYAQQAHFDLQGALKSLKEAVKLDPENFLAWARLAELWLSVGDLDRALKTAQKGEALNPNLARTQTVLGFAYLTQIKTKDAKKAFEKAIELDNAAPLPRLGLGLAKIREGDLKEGRAEIEIAASLDPNNSLIRSYMGKAYFEEKRDKHAMNQLALAKELDPLDPTPYFYDAIRKQTINRPVEALHDLQKSIELNDNRAVYRSSLMLDEDLAARSASLGRIYRDLGFEQLALVEGWKSLDTDPTNYSAHRFLADSYAALPRHEIARVSELLQSQLLQPINITPVQPHLGENNLYILERAGPADPAFNEFNQLFNRNRFALQVSGVGGGNDTLGDEITQSTVWGRFSYSLGQFHYETDGFRENNDMEQNVYNVFTQVSISPQTSLQGEFRKNKSVRGDMELTFTGSFDPLWRQEEKVDSLRFGLRHSFASHSDIIASYIHRKADLYSDFVPDLIELKSDVESDFLELRYLFRSNLLNLTAGAGIFNKEDITDAIFFGFPSRTDRDIGHQNYYFYSQIKLPFEVDFTLGASMDILDGTMEEKDQINPKLGLIWCPFPSTTVRGAYFSTLQRPLVARVALDPTLEPTHVAGFNQFFFGTEGEEVTRYGTAIDHKFSPDLHAGLELSARDLKVPIANVSGPTPVLEHREWDERLFRSYIYWTPFSQLALSTDYQYEWFERESTGGLLGPEEFSNLRTHRIPLAIRYFSKKWFFVECKATYVDQNGDFAIGGGPGPMIVQGDDQFWIVDSSLGVRFPKRHGILRVELKNLFDKEFNFQDTDPTSPRVLPGRLVFIKFTAAF
jgi:tetratricopeptide (TPR) repeat protein